MPETTTPWCRTCDAPLLLSGGCVFCGEGDAPEAPAPALAATGACWYCAWPCTPAPGWLVPEHTLAGARCPGSGLRAAAPPSHYLRPVTPSRPLARKEYRLSGSDSPSHAALIAELSAARRLADANGSALASTVASAARLREALEQTAAWLEQFALHAQGCGDHHDAADLMFRANQVRAALKGEVS